MTRPSVALRRNAAGLFFLDVSGCFHWKNGVAGLGRLATSQPDPAFFRMLIRSISNKYLFLIDHRSRALNLTFKRCQLGSLNPYSVRGSQGPVKPKVEIPAERRVLLDVKVFRDAGFRCLVTTSAAERINLAQQHAGQLTFGLDDTVLAKLTIEDYKRRLSAGAFPAFGPGAYAFPCSDLIS